MDANLKRKRKDSISSNKRFKAGLNELEDNRISWISPTSRKKGTLNKTSKQKPSEFMDSLLSGNIKVHSQLKIPHRKFKPNRKFEVVNDNGARRSHNLAEDFKIISGASGRDHGRIKQESNLDRGVYYSIECNYAVELYCTTPLRPVRIPSSWKRLPKAKNKHSFSQRLTRGMIIN